MLLPRRAALKLIVAVASLAVLAGACGGGVAPTATAPPTAPPRPTPTPAPIATPSGPTATPRPVPTPTPTPIPPTATAIQEQIKRGGTVRFYTPSDPPNLDPSKVEAFQLFFSLDEVWSNLVQFKSTGSYTETEFIPDLAERWEVSSTGDVYTFFLHPDARWQNLPPMNGRKLTAADVKWSFDKLLDPAYGSLMRARLSAVKEVRAPDDRTVVVQLKDAANNFLFDIAWATIKLWPKEVFERDGNFEKTVIGSGPFMYDRWEQGTRIRSKRNPSYWRAGDDRQPLPYLDALDVLVISDPQTHVAALRAGQLDFAGITGLTSTQIDPLKGVKGLNLIPSHPMFTAILGFNHTVKPLDDVRVRRALLKGMDVRFLMRNGTQAPDMPLESFVYSVAPKDLTYSQSKLETIFTRDVAGAKKLLADAGLGNGLKVELLIVFNRPPYPQEGALLKQQWAEIGVDLSLATGTDLETNNRYREGKYQILLWTLNLLGDPVTMVDSQWKTGASRNFFRYSNPKADQLITNAKKEFDRARLKQLLDQAQDALWDDVAGIPLSPGLNYQVQWQWLKGYANQYAWGNQGLKYAWLDR